MKIKKWMAGVMAVTFAMTSLPMTASALELPETAVTAPLSGDVLNWEDVLTYENNGDSITITDCDELAEGELIIPAEIDGLPVTRIGMATFRDCGKLTSVKIPEGVSLIQSWTFQFCESLTSVTLPDGITSIGQQAFGGCTNLPSVTIPDSVETLGTEVFQNCGSMTSITIPESVTSISSTTFKDMPNLTEINVAENNEVFSSVDGVLMQETTLVRYPSDKAGTSYVIPEGITGIGAWSFQDCMNLTSVVVPEGVTSIGIYAFSHCANLASVNLPDGIYSLQDYTFEKCESLTAVAIPSGVRNMGFGVFSDCTKLKYVIMPASVNSIRWTAFSGCTSLTDVYYAGTEEEWDKIKENSSSNLLLNATIHFGSTGPDPNKDDLMLGDLNGDGEIDSSDAAMILAAAAQLGITPDDSGLTAQQETAADIDHDGKIDAGDAAYVLSYSALSGVRDDITLEDVVGDRV